MTTILASKIKNIQCLLCNRKFRTNYALSEHTKVKHISAPISPEPLPEPYSFIGISFLDKIDSRVLHTFSCDICDRNNFKSKKDLENHKLNSGKQHIDRKSPCECEPEFLRINKVYRTKDKFIYKVIVECENCNRYPICIPLSADKELALKTKILV